MITSWSLGTSYESDNDMVTTDPRSQHIVTCDVMGVCVHILYMMMIMT